MLCALDMTPSIQHVLCVSAFVGISAILACSAPPRGDGSGDTSEAIYDRCPVGQYERTDGTAACTVKVTATNYSNFGGTCNDDGISVTCNGYLSCSYSGSAVGPFQCKTGGTDPVANCPAPASGTKQVYVKYALPPGSQKCKPGSPIDTTVCTNAVLLGAADTVCGKTYTEQGTVTCCAPGNGPDAGKDGATKAP